jgi:hypothetical protein
VCHFVCYFFVFGHIHLPSNLPAHWSTTS